MCFVQCMIKQLLDSVCDIQNNQGLGKGYQPQSSASASADNPNLDLVILEITETSPKNMIVKN